MREYRIGRVMRELRKMAELTQQELAKDICTQAQISKIENGEEYPSSITLYKLSKRLGVDVNYFFDTVESPRLDYVDAVKSLIRQYIRQRDYEAIDHIIKKEKESPLFQTTLNKQFLTWHEGICTYYLHKQKEKAFSLLYEAIDYTKQSKTFYKEKEIEILNSVAIIYHEEKEYENAEELYRQALKHITALPQIRQEMLKVRILYGLSKTLADMKQYEESITYSSRGIDLCITNESMYLFGELHYQTGENLIKLGRVKQGKEYLEKSVHIFQLQRNEKFTELVKSEINELFV
ncbi:helix-turn-helix transcriptional regulator [Priestia flexa]|jgi:transcriptional regulator with XRE-family HTH domain|uniref:Helix-turn-helix domain-containing protein n=1 Tax=Priestia flexa TaxID=86664 RepID=A0A8I1MJ48_9BACI|nr:helix-turn-helix domain-containing protein [Priestia flexa]MBN8253285.1 helix-turn-helix domain-containing protein [Priestia flexa]RIV04425.1 XRE family transcriptional regulator [Priestia flexa]UIR31409.1 helix-turn-helix transcriptional regulator [Priestia flexa]UZW65794.1 helix-turn-helix transcriptional regulator [Priestia flexa]